MKDGKINGLWSHLHWLTVLAEQGSCTAAAARLKVSKAAMSQRIAELERTAGVPLVRRTTRSMRLTEAGQRLVEETKPSYEAIAHSFSEIQEAAGTPQGLVRVTAPVALTRQHLVPMFVDFLKAHPGVRLELDLSDRLASLATEGFDLAIRHTGNAPDTHVAWELGRTESLLVASRGYLKRSGTPEAPADLAGHDCLHYPRGREDVVWSLERGRTGTRAYERASVPVRGPMSANNSEALRDAAAAGLGIALVPDFSANAKLANRELVRVLPQWRASGTFAERIYALRPYSVRVPRAVQLLVRHLQASFRPASRG